MSTPDAPLPLETLLAHRLWVRRLAWSLVRDEATVDDVEQRTWLAALDRPPRRAATAKAWLGRVVRNLAVTTYRAESRRGAHERRATRPEATRSVSDVVAEADLHTRLVLAVRELAEPYRTTVLLRWYEDLPPRAIAQEMGVPVETVRTRLRRAIELLRKRMDTEMGEDRGAWCLLLLGRRPEIETPGATTGTIGAAVGGGLAMASATKWLGAVVGLVLLGLTTTWFVRSGGSGEEVSPTGDSDASSGGELGVRAGRVGDCTVIGEVRIEPGLVPAAGRTVVLSRGSGEPWKLKTDERGAFRFEGVPRGGPYEVSVNAPGFALASVAGIELARHEIRNVGTLHLGAAVGMTVRVRTFPDRPIEGATVEAFPIVRGDDWTKSAARIGLIPVAAKRATADAQGIATFAEMALGDWVFVATKAGFARGSAHARFSRRDTEPAPATILLEPGFELEGRVLDTDLSPVAGAVVVAGRPPGETSWSFAQLSRAVTDAAGRFRLKALAADDFDLYVGRAGATPNIEATVRVPDVARYDVVLAARGKLTGIVSEAKTGRALEGVTVWAVRSQWSSARVAETTTGSDGRYAIDWSGGPITSLFAEKEGYFLDVAEPNKRPPEITVAAGDTVVRNLVLCPGARLFGVVKDSEGPVGGAKVTVYALQDGRGQLQRSMTTAGDGAYEFRGLAPVHALVLVEKEGFHVRGGFAGYWYKALRSPEAAGLCVEVPESGEVAHDVDLVRGAVVEGRVETEDDTALAGARVWVNQDPVESAPTGEDGIFRLDGVTPGSAVEMMAGKLGYTANGWTTVAVGEAGPTTGVVIKLRRELLLHGTVSAPPGVDLRDATVQVAPASQSSVGTPWEEQNRWRDAKRAFVKPDGTYECSVWRGVAKILIRARADGLPWAVAPTLDVSDGRDTYEVNLALEKGAEIVGRVVSKDGGDPIAAASIAILPHVERVQVMNGNPDWQPAACAVTDDAGSFRIAGVAPGRYDVRAQCPNYRAGTVVAGAGDTGIRLELAREMSIEGVVQFPDGKPAAGVSVRAGRPGEDVNAAPRTAVTHPDGRFRIAGVSADLYGLTIASPADSSDCASVRELQVDAIRGGSQDLRIVVQPAGAIGGRVVDGKGRAVASGIVFAQDPRYPHAEARHAYLGSNGTFTIRGLDQGPFKLSAQTTLADGRSAKRVETPPVVVGTSDVVIVVDEGLSISGVVVDSAGRPVVGVFLCAAKDGSYASTQTYAEGKFVLSGLTPGPYQVVVRAQVGIMMQTLEGVEPGSAELRVVVTRGVSISGVVQDEDGSPIEGARISVNVPSREGSSNETHSGSNGAFEIHGLKEDDRCDLTAFVPDRIRARGTGVVAGARNIKLVLARGRRISGRLVDSSGSPLANTRLYFVQKEAGDSLCAITDAKGCFTLGGLCDGTWTATAVIPPSRNPQPCGAFQAGDTDVEMHVAK